MSAPHPQMNVPTPTLEALIKGLSHTEIASILSTTYSHPSHSFATFQASHGAFLQARAKQKAAAPPKSFDHFSKSIWYTLNRKYARLRQSQQFEICGDIEQEISEAIKAIGSGCDGACHATKASGLETLRKVAKSILLCDEGEIAKQVRSSGMSDELAGAIAAILETLGPGDIERLMDDGYDTRLEEVARLMKSYGEEGWEELHYFFGTDE